MNDRLLNAMLKELLGKNPLGKKKTHFSRLNLEEKKIITQHGIYKNHTELCSKIKHCFSRSLVTKQDSLTLFMNFQFLTKPAQYKSSLVHKTNLSSPY